MRRAHSKSKEVAPLAGTRATANECRSRSAALMSLLVSLAAARLDWAALVCAAAPSFGRAARRVAAL